MVVVSRGFDTLLRRYSTDERRE